MMFKTPIHIIFTAENAECTEDKIKIMSVNDCIIKTYNFIFLSPRSSQSSRLVFDRRIQPYLKKQSQSVPSENVPDRRQKDCRTGFQATIDISSLITT
jgi:hypothetical protein